jgi:hypothetical protein
MPVLNGLNFLEAYLQLPLMQWQAIVIVMLTISLHPVDLAGVQELPIAGFLNKRSRRRKSWPYYSNILPRVGRERPNPF